MLNANNTSKPKVKPRPRKKLVHGVGINDHPEAVRVNGKIIPEYSAWTRMLNRCYSAKYQQKNPTYIGCAVADEWLYFSNFKQWLDDNGYDPAIHQVDKDLLIAGNKIYSPATCLLVSRQVNTLLNDCASPRGPYPLGVSLASERFLACISKYGKRTHIGRYDTPEEAEAAYRKEKAEHIREVAMTQSQPVKDALLRIADTFYL